MIVNKINDTKEITYEGKTLILIRKKTGALTYEEVMIGEKINNVFSAGINSMDHKSNVKALIALRNHVYLEQKKEDVVSYYVFRFDRTNILDKKNPSLLKIFLKKGCKFCGYVTKESQNYSILTTPNKASKHEDIELIKSSL